ncbi:serine hydrolase [Flavobacteriaceae bacterium]|nr:serine hydrolase [Flavobacteriaceae bacterium]MDA9015443.1 serine hydrolase [Flavobacteriaceae bacterium]MDB3862751.1 serine hydrolase [Flavobacteriaceae bacterium]
MKCIDKIFYLLFGLFLGSFTQSSAQEKTWDNFTIIDSIVNDGIRNKAFPGAQLLVYKKDRVLLHKSYGFHTYDSLSKVERTNLYDLASVTKVLAGTLAFMKLYELYGIDLNASVADYFPALKRSNKKQTRFKEVLSHSAGWLPYIAHQNLVRKKNGGFKSRTLQSKKSKRYPLQISDSLFVFKKYSKKIMRRIRKTKISTLGEYKYSGLWFFMIPELTEQLSGLPFESFLKKHFYDPLKLERLTFLPTRNFSKKEIVPTEYDTIFRKQLVQGWVHDEAAALMGGISGNAGLFSNAASIEPILEMLLNNGTHDGKVYLKAETIARFSQRAYPESSNRRGLGFDKPSVVANDEHYPSRMVSPSSYGHTGFTGTLIWTDPEKDSFIIFLSNRVYPSRAQRGLYQMNIREQLLDHAFEN